LHKEDFMGDLTRALVDLGAAAERRRSARSDLRAAIPTIVQELLRHLRTGDSFDVHEQSEPDHPNPPKVTYEVERVSWAGTGHAPPTLDRMHPVQVTGWHPKGAATLVRWPAAHLGKGGGAVLLDPRSNWSSEEWDGTTGPVEVEFEFDRSPSNFQLRGHRDYIEPELHVATDDELLAFASEAETVIRGFAERFADDASSMRAAVEATSKLGPR
jgi:hypothetical protein